MILLAIIVFLRQCNILKSFDGKLGVPYVYYAFPIAPSSPPVNPAASETSTTITLTWEAPEVENQNGIITGYVVIVTVMETGESFQRSSTTNSLTVVSLRPYTTYVCAIAAETSAGVGPFSITIIVQTDEACECNRPYAFLLTD